MSSNYNKISMDKLDEMNKDMADILKRYIRDCVDETNDRLINISYIAKMRSMSEQTGHSVAILFRLNKYDFVVEKDQTQALFKLWNSVLMREKEKLGYEIT